MGHWLSRVALLALLIPVVAAQAAAASTAEVIDGRVVLETDEAGHVHIAVDSLAEPDAEPQAERSFVFQPHPDTLEHVSADLAQARVLYRNGRQLVVSDRSGQSVWIFTLGADERHEAPTRLELLELAESLQGSRLAVTPTVLEGYGLAEYEGPRPLAPVQGTSVTRRPDRATDHLFQQTEDGGDDSGGCQSGGNGASQCSITCGPDDACSISCSSSSYACCNCEPTNCECKFF